MKRFILALAPLCGCAAPAVEPTAEAQLGSALTRLADDLADAAERRAGLSSMRVVVGDFVPVGGADLGAAWSQAHGARLDALGAVLRHELQLALATRMNVYAPDPLAAVPAPSVATPFEPTHAVVGSLAPVGEGQRLELSLRLVALDTNLIVAPARASLPLGLADLLDEAVEFPLPTEVARPPTPLEAAQLAQAAAAESELAKAGGGLSPVEPFVGPASERIRLLRSLGHGVPDPR